MTEAPNWSDIEAAYRAGTSIATICRQFRVSMADLLKAIRAGGWKRDANEPPTGGGAAGEANDGASPAAPPALLDEAAREAIDDAVAEGIEEIMASHKGIARKLREQFNAEFAEFEASIKFLSTFRDAEHIARLAALDDGGKELRAYLSQCLTHHAKRIETQDKLSRNAREIINLKRAVWSIDAGSGNGAESWDDLLEDTDQPLPPRDPLPDNVIEFDQKVVKGGGQ